MGPLEVTHDVIRYLEWSQFKARQNTASKSTKEVMACSRRMGLKGVSLMIPGRRISEARVVLRSESALRSAQSESFASYHHGDVLSCLILAAVLRAETCSMTSISSPSVIFHVKSRFVHRAADLTHMYAKMESQKRSQWTSYVRLKVIWTI
ncbi:hypothetical protein PILCRDRAFT_130433 [Piloderma croceum F 1598]|uniref:Uncharacterized protein n=1 Tax=Piloderma croceum (strain F 1598) TaxID=765440 RepID=A0A0C3GLM4_PILCF|nr:hypothetical protein PILCRDRAFT_130433 [Piloderma croceum F 1598]